MEQYTRTKVDNILKNLGWKLDGYDKNVYQEEPRTKEEKKKLGRNRPDYVLYATDRNRYEPLAVIEVKSQFKQGLDGAIKQAESYAKKLKASLALATNGFYVKTKHVIKNCPLRYNGEELHELIGEKDALAFLENQAIDRRPKRIEISQQQLIKVFKKVNDLLRNIGLQAGYERFSEFVTILFLKLFSEKEKHTGYKKLEACYSWHHLSKVESTSRLSYLSKSILPNIAKLYEDKEIFPQGIKIKESKVFEQIYTLINPLQLSDIDQDVKGSAFEYFLATASSAAKDLGEYFTPRHIVKAMVKLLDPKIGEKIYDPFCGTGGMLTASYKHIFNNMERSRENIEKLKQDTFYGRELTATAKIAKMNMILADDGHNHIKQCNSLTSDNLAQVEGKFDVIITNFPFSLKPDEDQKQAYKRLYDIPSNHGDSICLQHCIKALKKGGRMAVICPEGVLFRQDLKKTREYLLAHCHINHIISLPAGVFQPYTAVKTNILHCTKKKSTDKVWFFNIKNDGFSLNTQRQKIPGENDLDKLLAFIGVGEDYKGKFGFHPVDITQIKSNKNLSLRLNDYLAHQLFPQSKWKMVRLGDTCRCYQPKTITKKEIRSTGRHKVYGANGVIGYYGTYNHENEEVAVTCRGASCGAVNFTAPKSWITGNAMVCKPTIDHICKKYLYHILSSVNMSRITTGSAQPQIIKSNIENLILPLPPLEEQKRILAEIAQEEAIIAQNKILIEKSRKKIQAKIKALW